MSLIYRCDRCKAVSEPGLSQRQDGIDGPPPLPTDWVKRVVPVRGSKGARSSIEVLLCVACDDSLYAWLHEQGTTT